MTYYALLILALFVTPRTPSVTIDEALQSAEMVPTLDVQLHPFTGNMPASMANGRPVYKFVATVFDERKKIAFASDSTLLQRGMTRELHGRAAPGGEIRGTVRLGSDGVAKYRVVYSRSGRPILSASANLRLGAE